MVVENILTKNEYMIRTAKVVINEIVETPLGYTQIIARIIELDNPLEKYLWCCRVPNWDSPDEPQVDCIGYLEYETVEAGVTTWYNGTDQIPYKYNQVYFRKFIRERRHRFRLERDLQII